MKPASSSSKMSSNHPIQNDRTEESSILCVGLKSGFTMPFASRIEAFGVKPDFSFSVIIGKCHNDLFSKGALVFSEETFLYACDKYILKYRADSPYQNQAKSDTGHFRPLLLFPHYL